MEKKRVNFECWQALSEVQNSLADVRKKKLLNAKNEENKNQM